MKRFLAKSFDSNLIIELCKPSDQPFWYYRIEGERTLSQVSSRIGDLLPKQVADKICNYQDLTFIGWIEG